MNFSMLEVVGDCHCYRVLVPCYEGLANANGLFVVFLEEYLLIHLKRRLSYSDRLVKDHVRYQPGPLRAVGGLDDHAVTSGNSSSDDHHHGYC